jgi:hypothetical protein
MHAPQKDRFDTSSSYHYTDFEILLRIITEDPTMQSCLKVIVSTCLSHGIEVESKSGKSTDEYAAFVQRHYTVFCDDAVRCMFMCGFVPWRIRKLPNGALVPETIPIGTFSWSVEKNNTQQRSAKKMKVAANTAALSYKISFIDGLGFAEESVNIYQYLKPRAEHMSSSLQSPLSGVVEEYRHIHRALARAEYADEWNTQGKFICSYNSTNNMYSMNEGNSITNDWSVSQNRGGMLSDLSIPTELEQNVYVRDAVLERVVESKSVPHVPIVYSLPKNSKLESVPTLHSNVDISILQNRVSHNISSLLGVPFEIIGGGYSDVQGNKKSLENSRMFIANMTNMCSHLQTLLADVYEASFPGSKIPVSFRLRASPRLEVNNISELLSLIDAGLLSSQDAAAMTNMILGLDLKNALHKK